LRLLCLIDNLGGGGAQRQLCSLAVLLKGAGLDVGMLTYHAGGMFAEELARKGIPHHVVASSGGLSRVHAVRRAIGAQRPDVVLAFLPMPSLYAELAGLMGRKWGLIVGERSTTPGAGSLRMRSVRFLHRTADAVVTFSHANRVLIERSTPALKGRVSTIYNVVDLEAFSPAPLPQRSDGTLRIVVAASYRSLKNVRGWIEAMRRVRDAAPDRPVVTDWYGGGASRGRGHEERALADALIERHALADWVRLHDGVADIAVRYRESHAVALPSLFEGLPNVVCEGMACARPVATSEVSDASYMIDHRVSGVLFDPTDAGGMAAEVRWLAARTDAELLAMGRAGRERAERLFAASRVTSAYVSLLDATASRRLALPVFWPPERGEGNRVCEA